jgi:sulfofructose kinase
MKSYDVVGLGYACLDILGTVPHLPELDTKLALNTLVIQGGGPVATALVTLARLGSRTLFAGRLGDDDFGRAILDGLKDEHVGVEVHVSPGTTSPFAFVMVTPDGKRTVLWTRGTAPLLAPDDVPVEVVRAGRVLLLDDIEIPAATRAAHLAREAGIPVILGVGTPRAGIEGLIRLADDIVMAEKFPFRLTGERDHHEALGAILSMGPARATVTLGERGSLHRDKDGAFIEQPALAAATIDTTGAGDVFCGAYVYGRLHDWPMAKVLRFASAVAARQTEALGGRTAIPSLAEALELADGTATPTR